MAICFIRNHSKQPSKLVVVRQHWLMNDIIRTPEGYYCLTSFASACRLKTLHTFIDLRDIKL